LQEKLGEGAMGVVWKAFDLTTGSFVAIKVMKDASDRVAVELFERERQALLRLNHPNIVPIREVGAIEHNSHRMPFFVMPLLEGSTLADMIKDASARLTVAGIVEIASQVCKGLHAAHQKGFIHRDLKPSNIFVMPDDTAQIIDFGIVHLANEESMTGFKGTPQYTSPEQAQGQVKKLGPASDIFSLGVVLYEALTRRKPFARNTVDETFEAVCKYMPPSVSEINPSVDRLVSQVVQKCLAKQPINRFNTVRDVGETLQNAYHNKPIPMFDVSLIQPRIDRVKDAIEAQDYVLASEILAKLESEGHLDPQITGLRDRIEIAVTQKQIRQLLEIAKARSEQGENVLALDKICEVLKLDPENTEASALRKLVETQISEKQINEWLDLAESHLRNRDFLAARHAAEQVLTIRPGDIRALEKLEKIESTEVEAKQIREQKDHLYTAAMRAYQNYEIDTAVSKMDRLFALAHDHPEADVPERDAVYQSFYKEVVSERETRSRGLEEVQRLKAEKKFEAAKAKCNDFLMKHPNDGTFEKLKFQIEDAERQELSAYIADVSSRVELEPDLDRCVNILREACERYPAEPHFTRQLKLYRERRDLVNSIVAKARQFEERAQFAEAYSELDFLRNIPPQYPGLAFELERLKKKRDEQVLEEKKGRVVEKTQHLIESRAYAKAIELAILSLQEYPGDAELERLLVNAEEELEHVRESKKLFEEGQEAYREKDFPTAAELLRSALALDSRNRALRDVLINALVEQARAVVGENWRSAEPLYEEAVKLDAAHPSVRSLKAAIDDAKQSESVTQYIQEVKSLGASGDHRAAAERLKDALAKHPNDPRLRQHDSAIQRNLIELKRTESRKNDKAELERQRQVLDQNPDLTKVKEVLETSYTIQAKHPGDAEIGQLFGEIREAATRMYPEPEPVADQEGGGRAHLVERIGAAIKGVTGRVSGLTGRWLILALGAVAAVLLVVGVIYEVITHRESNQVSHNAESRPASIKVQVTTDPPDSTITVNGKPLTERTLELKPGTYSVKASRIGYKTKEESRTPQSEWKLTLEPEPLHISVQAPVKKGVVQLDGAAAANVTDGGADYEMAPDNQSHTLRLLSGGQPVFSMDFKALPGACPQVTSLNSKDMLVIASLGSEARLHSGAPLHNMQLGDQPVGPVTVVGVDLPQLTDQNHDLRFVVGATTGTVAIDVTNAPQLIAHNLTSDVQVVITSNVPAATLTVNQQIVKPQPDHSWQFSRPPGNYSFTLSAEGFYSETKSLHLAVGWPVNRYVRLMAKTTPPPPAATLVLNNVPRGSSVFLDQQLLGTAAADGTFPDTQIPLGDHVIEIRKDGYQSSNSFRHNFASGSRVPHDCSDMLTGILRFTFSFKGWVTVSRNLPGEKAINVTNDHPTVHLQPGTYKITVHADGNFTPDSVTVVAGETQSVELKAAQ
jgi:serine/threonine-protein kinase